MNKVLLILLFVIATTVYGFSNEKALSTLMDLKKSQQVLQKEIDTKNALIEKIASSDEKKDTQDEVKILIQQQNDIKEMLKKVASGIDITLVNPKEPEKSSTLNEDFHLLLQPLIQQAKESTGTMRKKAQLKEEEEYDAMLLEEVQKAQKNISELLKEDTNQTLHKDLTLLSEYWEKQNGIVTRNLNAVRQQIDLLKKNETSLGESLQKNVKKFFQNQGLVLLEGIGIFIVVLTAMQLFYIGLVKLFPVMLQSKRSYYVRVADLFYKVLTVVLAWLAPMGVFYYEENWMFFSIGILLFIGIMWTISHLIPKLWQQGRLLLNIGAVREEERINYHGLPWQVKNINIFTVLENPDTGVALRIPIEELVGLASRPSAPNRPWFPCRMNDWVLLSDTFWGKVLGISLEFIELVDLGGSHKTYQVSDFLSLSPLNLSTGFRITETIGISYKHQKESTHEIPMKLEKFILNKMNEADYTKGLDKLSIQFESAGNSSLDISVLANFKGEMAPYYLHLRREINRWCVDACTEYNWEIPFPQLTIHQGQS